MSHDENRLKIFALLPLKPNGQKNMVAHDRIPPDPAISRHVLPNGVHEWSLLELNISARSTKHYIK
jgi:hypothetical protein